MLRLNLFRPASLALQSLLEQPSGHAAPLRHPLQHPFRYLEAHNMIKIIGIDPGLSETGIGVVTGKGLSVQAYSYGSIHTSKDISLPHRLDKIYSKLTEILQREHPDHMVVEDVFSLNDFPKSGILLGKVTGVLLLAGFKTGVSVSEVAVREAKKVLTGNGSATKQQLEKAVRKKLRLVDPIKPYHASDALGLALIGLYRYG